MYKKHLIINHLAKIR